MVACDHKYVLLVKMELIFGVISLELEYAKFDKILL